MFKSLSMDIEFTIQLSHNIQVFKCLKYWYELVTSYDCCEHDETNSFQDHPT